MATNLKRRLNVGSMPKRSISRTSWAVGLRLSDLRSNSRARISSSRVVSRAWLPAEPLVSRGKDSAPAMVMEDDTDGGLVSDDGRGKERKGTKKLNETPRPSWPPRAWIGLRRHAGSTILRSCGLHARSTRRPIRLPRRASCRRRPTPMRPPELRLNHPSNCWDGGSRLKLRQCGAGPANSADLFPSRQVLRPSEWAKSSHAPT